MQGEFNKPAATSKSCSGNPYLRKLKGLDLLAPDVSLNYRGSSGVKTFCGVFLTLAYVGVFGAGTIITGSKYFDTTQPLVLQEVSNSFGNYPRVGLVQERRFASLLFFLGDYPIPFEELSSYVTVLYEKRTQEITLTDSGPQDKTVLVAAPMVPFKSLPSDVRKFLPTTDAVISGYLETYGVSPDYNLQDFEVLGPDANSVTKTFGIYVYPCSLGPGKCAPADAIAKIGITYAHVEPKFNMTNYETPIEFDWMLTDFFYVNIGMYQRMHHQVTKTEVYNDGGLLSERKLVSYSYSQMNQLPLSRYRDANNVQCTIFPITEDNCLPYLSFHTMSSARVEKLLRVYTGVVETLGEIGGIRDMIITAALGIYWIFYTRLTRKELVDCIYDVPQEYVTTPRAGPGNPASSQQVSEILQPAEVQNFGSGRLIEQGKPKAGTSLQENHPGDRGSNKTGTPTMAEVDFDYHTASETIEDTLDVVNLVRRIQWLETFARFVRERSELFTNPDGVQMYSMANYLIHKQSLQPPGSIGTQLPRLPASDVPNVAGFEFSSESQNATKELTRDYDAYLKRIVLNNADTSGKHSTKMLLGTSTKESSSVSVGLRSDSQRKASLHRQQRLLVKVVPAQKAGASLIGARKQGSDQSGWLIAARDAQSPDVRQEL